jgi:thiamine-phosphate pyrophosphorylase
MEALFTAAAHRALAEAAAWSAADESPKAGVAPALLETAAVLLGLLAESECRAAMMLARHGIDAAAVRGRWPRLGRQEARFPAWSGSEAGARPTAEGAVPVHGFSAGFAASLAAARRRLFDYPRPLVLATEHILLGLADADHDVAVWLRGQGLDPETIEAEIHQNSGHRRLDVSEEIGPPVDFPPEGKEEGGRRKEESEVPHADPSSFLLPPSSLPSLRVIDAAGNRAREGLRVVEDYLRFVLDDRYLTGQLKGLRHDLAAVLARFPLGHRLAARETQADVGTAITTGGERVREDPGQVLAANFARLQEALRSLEEFAKLLDADAAAGLKQLRYRSYTLQRAVEITRSSASRLAAARLYVLVDGRANLDEFAALASSLVQSGVDVLQLRDKRLDDRRLLEWAAVLREICRDAGVLFIVNDRPDLAALTQADGVHVGQEDLSVKAARQIVGPDALVGVSTHSIDQARQAVLDGANYIGVGPTFPSETKQFDQFPGLELLRAVAAEIRLPAFAIGGIGPENLAEVLQTGIGRVAVSGAILDAPDPAVAALALSRQLTGQPGPT